MSDLFENDDNNNVADPQEWYIKQKDASTLDARIARLRHLHKINPEGMQLMGSVETVNAYREMQWCFIEGFYLSVIVLAQCLVEKVLQDWMQRTGNDKVAGKGLNAILLFAKDKKLLSEYLIEKADYLRLIRNPIIHLKEMGHEHNADLRSYRNRNSPDEQLHIDAKNALELASYIVLKVPSLII